MIGRVFYITQGSLCVWLSGAASGRFDAEFTDDDDGVRGFDRYLAMTPDSRSTLLIDVIEEEFFHDTVPKLGKRDRDGLIRLRRQRKFRRTPYRTSQYLGKPARKEGQYMVVHSAISNHELVDPWLDVIHKYQTPLSGIFSVPLMTAAIFKRLFSCKGSAMFVAPHQGDKLRQVFVQDGNVMSARLSQSPGISDPSYPQFVVTETMRSRRYLERTRILGSTEVLEVCVIADADAAAEVTTLALADGNNSYRFVGPESAARRCGVADLTTVDRFEHVFLMAVAKNQPKHSYANSGEDRYWHMRNFRNAIIGTSLLGAVAASVVAAMFLSDSWIVRKQNIDMQSQAEYLLATYRRENEKLEPIKADSYEMKFAVDTGELILANRVPVPWVMNQLGSVLGEYPDIQIQELRWVADAVQSENTQTQQRGEQLAENVETIAAVSAVLTADIIPFDGDLRRAFARIDALAADFESRTDFQSAVAIEYPLDASTSAAISGEISSEVTHLSARFQLRLYYELPGHAGTGAGHNEST